MKFEVHDIVTHKGKKAKITARKGKSTCGEDLFMVKFIETSKTEVMRESELEIEKFAFHTIRGKESGGCSCGAWTTDFPDNHADYCWKDKNK